MLIEKLEDRRLLSAAPAKISLVGLAAFLDDHPTNDCSFVSISEGIRQVEQGIMLLTLGDPSSSVLKTSRTAPATAAAQQLTIDLPAPSDPFALAFNPSTLEPFGSEYTVKLPAKPSLSLFNITQKIGKEKLHFTGKLNAKLTVLSGVLDVTGPTNQVSFTYTTA
jgi:hypothetical protein